MAGKKKNGWSEPVIKGPKKKPSTKTVMRKAEEQRRGMAATRKKAQAKRPTPMTAAQVRAVRERDRQRRLDDMFNSPAARRSRERTRFQGR